MSENYLKGLFIDEAKPALDRHNEASGDGENLYDIFWDTYQNLSQRRNIHSYQL